MNTSLLLIDLFSNLLLDIVYRFPLSVSPDFKFDPDEHHLLQSGCLYQIEAISWEICDHGQEEGGWPLSLTHGTTWGNLDPPSPPLSPFFFSLDF